MANFIDELVTFANAHPVETIATLACVLLGLLLAVLTKKPGKPKQFLEPTEFKTLPLSSKKWITHNTLRLKFDLPHPSMRLGLPVGCDLEDGSGSDSSGVQLLNRAFCLLMLQIGQHITFLAKDAEGKDVYRAYTPVSDDDQLGSVEFVIKIYPQGKMSQVLNKLEVGQTMLMKGPKVRGGCRGAGKGAPCQASPVGRYTGQGASCALHAIDLAFDHAVFTTCRVACSTSLT